MNLKIKPISDGQILTMIGINDVKAWGYLYDKYAAAMFSIVLQITDSNELANKIFTEAFLQLKEKKILLKIKFALCPFLLRYMHNYASQYVKKWEITTVPVTKAIDTQLIHLLCTQCYTIKDAAFKLNITEAAAIRNLQIEFLLLRNKNYETREVVKF